MGRPWPGPAAVLPLVACEVNSLPGFNVIRYSKVIRDQSLLRHPRPRAAHLAARSDVSVRRIGPGENDTIVTILCMAKTFSKINNLRS
jgi:hypothetical protein